MAKQKAKVVKTGLATTGESGILTVRESEILGQTFTEAVSIINKGQLLGNSAAMQVAHGLYIISGESHRSRLKALGYKDFADFAEERFGIGKTNAYDAAKVFGAFGDNESGEWLPEYTDYNFGQLRTIYPAVYGREPIVPVVEDKSKAAEVITERFPSTMSVRQIIEEIKHEREEIKRIVSEAPSASETESPQLVPTSSTPAEAPSTPAEETFTPAEDTITGAQVEEGAQELLGKGCVGRERVEAKCLPAWRQAIESEFSEADGAGYVNEWVCENHVVSDEYGMEITLTEDKGEVTKLLVAKLLIEYIEKSGGKVVNIRVDR